MSTPPSEPRPASESRRFAFLITAAGSGKRMGGGTKKEFRLLEGTPVLVQTLKNFLDTSLFSCGVITCVPGSHGKVENLLAEIAPELEKLQVPLMLCDGGSERQESVRLGLKHLSLKCPELKENGFVLIHDGARPWADPGLITRIAEKTLLHRACAPVIPSIDALKEINESGIITGHHPRKKTVGVQTPQGFAFSEILAAHDRAAADGRHYIDDTEIFSRYEGDVYTVEGSTGNRKITYAGDIAE